MKLINLSILAKDWLNFFNKNERITDFEASKIYISFSEADKEKYSPVWQTDNHHVDIIVNNIMFSTSMKIILMGMENDFEYQFYFNPSFNMYDVDKKETITKNVKLDNDNYERKIKNFTALKFNMLENKDNMKEAITNAILKKMMSFREHKSLKKSIREEDYNLKIKNFLNEINSGNMLIAIEKSILDSQLISKNKTSHDIDNPKTANVNKI